MPSVRTGSSGFARSVKSDAAKGSAPSASAKGSASVDAVGKRLNDDLVEAVSPNVTPNFEPVRELAVEDMTAGKEYFGMEESGFANGSDAGANTAPSATALSAEEGVSTFAEAEGPASDA